MRDLNTYTHLFFDLDDTLTPSRSLVEQDMKELLLRLPVDLVAVSGATKSQIATQLPDIPLFTLGQNGNHATHRDGTPIWEKRLSPQEKSAIYGHISQLITAADFPVRAVNDLIEDRLSQISYSTIGHHSPLTLKHAFDPNSSVRNRLLTQFPLLSSEVEVRIGGTTCFDYFKVGSHKGSNVREFIAHMGWKSDECVYFGDKLMPGGNDETVVGVIDTVAVTSSQDTYQKLLYAFG
jgi:HAD superfamily hydrolase (TIGR01484 family)